MSEATPPGWHMASVGEVARYVRGVTYQKEHARQQPSEGLVPVLRANNIGVRLIFEDLVYVPSRFVSEEQRVRDGDLVIAMSSGSKSVVGKAAMASRPPEIGFGAFCGVLRPSERVHPRYLGLYFQTKAYRNSVSELSKGVNINNLKAEHLLDQPLPLPPLQEQQRIVSRIEELFSEIDEGERALERVGRLVERYRQSVLKAAVTGELTAKAREGGAFEGESGADVLERALSRRAHLVAHQLSRGAPVEPDVAGLPALPAGWVWASVDQLCGQFGNGLSRKPAHEPPGTPILRISSVRPLAVDAADVRYYAEESGERLDGYFVANGDLLFTRYNGSRELVGVSGVYRGDSPVLHPDKLIKARVISSGLVIPDYLEIALNAGESWKFLTSCVKTSAGQHGIAGADIKRAPVPLPPFNEQREIVALWWQFESQVGALKSSVPTEARRGQALRQSILKAAFSGQLVPQDPRDEPASALLARLAAQASAAPPAPKRRGRKLPS